MTVLAAEEGAAAVSRGSVTRQAGRRGSRRVSAAAPRQERPPRQQRQRTRREQPARARRETSRRGGTTPGRSNYQPVILAEFIAAVLLVAATPFADKNKPQGLSPYAGKDVIQLAAITIAYLILALVSVGGRGAGRVAAWFGGLILLTVGLYEAANVAKILDVFGTGQPPDTAAEGGGGPVLPPGAEGGGIPLTMLGLLPTGTGQAPGTTRRAGEG